jgi:hypothetical protein
VSIESVDHRAPAPQGLSGTSLDGRGDDDRGGGVVCDNGAVVEGSRNHAN